jgi:plastocyanin
LVLAGWTLALVACAPRQVAVSVVAHDFFFDPDTIEVPAGAEVTLTLINRGKSEHVWMVFEKGYTPTFPHDEEDTPHVYARTIADVTVQETFTFTAPSEKGEYTTICSLPEHAEKGMIGTLVVK